MRDRIARALRKVEPDWTPGRAARGLRRLEPALRSRRRQKTALALTAAAGIAGAALILLGRWSVLPSGPAPTEARLSFPDGTTVRATVPATELRVAEDTPARQVVQIVRGGARFDVSHIPARTFRVQLRSVAVEVLGTVFRVEEVGPRVRVAVERGRVRVLQGADRRTLGPGEILELPSRPALPPTIPDPGPATRSGLSTTSPAPAMAPPPASVEPAPTANPDSATAPPPASAGPVPTTAPRSSPAAKATPRLRETDAPGALLAAADRARRAGQPQAAARQLRRLAARFPNDDRAPLAAFTLGLLALDGRRPKEAAQAFALARRLQPAGELAEDALAREVQAWFEAGQDTTAHDRATEYQRLYPAGRLAGQVRRLGGLR